MQHMQATIEELNSKSIYNVFQVREKSNNIVGLGQPEDGEQGETEKYELYAHQTAPRIKDLKRKFEEHQQNSEMRKKMDNIQQEVRGFSSNIDEFAKICDAELENLLENIDTITADVKNIKKS